GFVLLVTAVGHGGGSEEKHGHLNQEEKQGNRSDIGKTFKAQNVRVAGNKPSTQAIDQKETCQGQERRKQDRSNDVAKDVMPHLVGHDNQQFFLLKAGNQGIPENDPLGAKHPRDVGVERLGVDALVDLEDPAAFDSRPAGKFQDRLLEPFVFHGPEIIEQGIDPDRLDQHSREQEGHGEEGRVQPPPARRPGQQQVGNPGEGKSNDHLDANAQQEIGHPLGQALVRQAVGVLAKKTHVIIQRKIDQEDDRQVEHHVQPDRWKPPA